MCSESTNQIWTEFVPDDKFIIEDLKLENSKHELYYYFPSSYNKFFKATNKFRRFYIIENYINKKSKI